MLSRSLLRSAGKSERKRLLLTSAAVELLDAIDLLVSAELQMMGQR